MKLVPSYHHGLTGGCRWKVIDHDSGQVLFQGSKLFSSVATAKSDLIFTLLKKIPEANPPSRAKCPECKEPWSKYIDKTDGGTETLECPNGHRWHIGK